MNGKSMRLKYFIYSLLLLVGSFCLTGCNTAVTNIFKNVSVSQGGVFVISIISIILACFALILSYKGHGKDENSEEQIENSEDALSPVDELDLREEIKNLNGRISELEQRLDKMNSNINVSVSGQHSNNQNEGEIELPPPTNQVGYFGVPIPDSNGKGYFKKLDTLRDGTSRFSASIIGGVEADFEPLSIQMVRENAIDPAVTISGEGREIAHEIVSCKCGKARFSGDKWIIIEKAEVCLK